MLHWPAGQACASGHIMRHTKGGEFGHQRGASTAGSLGPAAQSVAPKAERSCSRSFTSTVPSSFTSTERSVPPKPVSAWRQLCAIHGAMGCASVRATEDVPESKESRSLTLTRPSASCGCVAVHSVSVFVRTAVRRVHVGWCWGRVPGPRGSRWRRQSRQLAGTRLTALLAGGVVLPAPGHGVGRRRLHRLAAEEDVVEVLEPAGGGMLVEPRALHVHLIRADASRCDYAV